jgi:hypothetical protein
LRIRCRRRRANLIDEFLARARLLRKAAATFIDEQRAIQLRESWL